MTAFKSVAQLRCTIRKAPAADSSWKRLKTFRLKTYNKQARLDSGDYILRARLQLNRDHARLCQPHVTDERKQESVRQQEEGFTFRPFGASNGLLDVATKGACCRGRKVS